MTLTAAETGPFSTGLVLLPEEAASGDAIRRLDEAARDRLENAKSPNTRRAYRQRWSHFVPVVLAKWVSLPLPAIGIGTSPGT